MLTSSSTLLAGLFAGNAGQAALAVNGCRTMASISSDDGLTGGGSRVEDTSDTGPIVVDSQALREIAIDTGDRELTDLLDRLDEVSGRFLEHATKQLDALKDGKTDEAKKHYDQAMELSLPWHRLMRDIHEHAKRKGYYGP